MTKSSGPLRAAASAGFGSGVAAKDRLAEYSLSFSFDTLNSKHDGFEASGGRERLFLQGVEGKLLSGKHEAGWHARLVRRAPADSRDQRYLLSDAEGDRARELGEEHARAFPLRDQGIAAHHAHGAAESRHGSRFGRLPLQEPCGTGRQARPGAVPAAAVHKEGPAAPRRVSSP